MDHVAAELLQCLRRTSRSLPQQVREVIEGTEAVTERCLRDVMYTGENIHPPDPPIPDGCHQVMDSFWCHPIRAEALV
jgi:hypothetical protein